MLSLVLTHRDLVGVVEEDVCGLESRIGEQAAGHEVSAVRFVFELGHPPKFTERSGALHNPGALGVLGEVPL